jgi:hypothetical protein
VFCLKKKKKKKKTNRSPLVSSVFVAKLFNGAARRRACRSLWAARLHARFASSSGRLFRLFESPDALPIRIRNKITRTHATTHAGFSLLVLIGVSLTAAGGSFLRNYYAMVMHAELLWGVREFEY